MSDKLIVPKEFSEPKSTNILPFEVITGGRGGSGPNWLKALPKGTVFLACPKVPKYTDAVRQQQAQQHFEVSEFTIAFKWNECCKLYVQAEGRDLYFNVHMQRFSDAMEKVEVIGEVHD